MKATSSPNLTLDEIWSLFYIEFIKRYIIFYNANYLNQDVLLACILLSLSDLRPDALPHIPPHLVRVPNLYFGSIQYSWGTWLVNTMAMEIIILSMIVWFPFILMKAVFALEM